MFYNFAPMSPESETYNQPYTKCQHSMAYTQRRISQMSHQYPTTVVPYSVITPLKGIHQAVLPLSPASICSSSDESYQQTDNRKYKIKRSRTAYTTEQVIEMEEEYKRSQYMPRHRRYEVAQRLNLDEKNIKVWFQNRRMRGKREGKVPQKKIMTSAEQQEELPSAQEEIVRRFMSYSQLQALPQPVAAAIPQPSPSIFPPTPPPTEFEQSIDVMALLAESNSQTTPALDYADFDDILKQLDESAQLTIGVAESELQKCVASEAEPDQIQSETEASLPTSLPTETPELEDILDLIVDKIN